MPDPILPPVRFAGFDPITGVILTCYDSSVHGDTIPAEAIEMTDAQFFGHINSQPRLRVNVLAVPPAFVEDVPAPPSLEEQKSNANLRVLGWINALTNQLRAGYAQDESASWPAKAPQAREVVAGGDPGTLILAEASATGQTPMQIAQTIVARAEITEAIIGKVSGLRRMVMADIQDATNEAEIETAIAAGLATATLEAQAFGLTIPE